MPLAIELYLDDHATRRIREIWAALDEQGIRSPGSVPDTVHCPHVTLASFQSGDETRIADAARPPLAGAPGLALSLEPLGFFLSEEALAFLGVVPTSQLLDLHRAVFDAIGPHVTGLGRFYRPGVLMPHCTLATGVTDHGAVARVVSEFHTPIPAFVASAHLVELPSGKSRLPLTPEA